MASVTIDGQSIEAGEGETILDAAERADIFIPTLCNHPDLPAFGGCRMCLVKVEGMGSYVPACSTPARDGMVIHSDIEELKRLRRNILELILSEHPSGCIICDDRELCFDYHRAPSKAGRTTGCRFCPEKDECDLYDIAASLDIEDIRLPIEYREREVRRDDPFIERDYNLCILCGRCVRVCDEIRGVHAVDFVNRGHETTIGTAFQAPLLDSGCIFCGACIDVCPTGALSERRMKWGGSPEQRITTTCMLCPVGCSIEVDVTRDRILNVHAAGPGHGTTQLCVKGRFTLPALMQHHERLARPMVRDDVLKAASWDDAIGAAAELLRRYEPHEIGFVVSPGMINEGGYMLRKIAHALECDNVGVASGMATAGALQTITSGGSIDIASADVVLLLGVDLRITTAVLAVSVYQAKKNGARVVTIGCDGAPRWADHAIATPSVPNFLDGLQAALSGEACNNDVATMAEHLQNGSVAILYGPGVMADDGTAIASLAGVASSCNGTVIPCWDGANVQGLLMLDCLPGGHGNNPVRDMTGLKALYLTQPLPDIPEHVETIILQDVYTSNLLERADVVLPAASFSEEQGSMLTCTGERRILQPCTTPAGQSRPDWDILSRLGVALGCDGFAYDDVAAVTEEAMDHIAGGKKRPGENDAGGEERMLPDGMLCYRGHAIGAKVPDFARLVEQWRDDDA